MLVARKDPRRHQRVASRWLLRYLEEDPHATIDEAALAASSLMALTRVAHPSGSSAPPRPTANCSARRRLVALSDMARNVCAASSDVPVGFVDLLDRSAHEPGELERRQFGRDRE